MVTPRFDPLLDIPDGADWISYPAGDPDGIFILGHNGALYCFGVPVTRGVNGLGWISGQHAERLDFPTGDEESAHPGATVVILRTDGARSVRVAT
jgi:hypothetical protein